MMEINKHQFNLSTGVVPPTLAGAASKCKATETLRVDKDP